MVHVLLSYSLIIVSKYIYLQLRSIYLKSPEILLYIYIYNLNQLYAINREFNSNQCILNINKTKIIFGNKINLENTYVSNIEVTSLYKWNF